MADDSVQAGRITLSLRHVRADNFVVYYANGAQINATQWDVQVIFEQIVMPPSGMDTDHVDAPQHLAVIMSREHAKSFLVLLQKQLIALDEITAESADKSK
jgi:hypothetical protein